MADTVSKKFVNSIVLHTPTGFFVANAGETRDIPADLVERATRDGAFGKEAANAASAPAEPGDDLDGMTKKQLQDVAAAEGVAVESDANKATLLDAIRSHRSGGAPTE